nr:MAG TPA: hypothetical protein [Caudoviricetes sp.]
MTQPILYDWPPVGNRTRFPPSPPATLGVLRSLQLASAVLTNRRSVVPARFNVLRS